MKKLFAFTLTEVMITVGVIGVVAALTVPDLVKNYQKDTQVVALRKVVNEFESAVDMYTTEEGKKYFRQTAAMKSDAGMQSFMNSKFKLRSGSNFASTYRSINGNTKDFTCSGSIYSLANSAALCVKLEKSSTSSPGGAEMVNPSKITEYHVYVDINGNEKPNLGGRDMFDFYVGPSGNISPTSFDPKGIAEFACGSIVTCAVGEECTITPEEQAKIDKCEEDKTCIGKPFGETCLAKIINANWKMDY